LKNAETKSTTITIKEAATPKTTLRDMTAPDDLAAKNNNAQKIRKDSTYPVMEALTSNVITARTHIKSIFCTIINLAAAIAPIVPE